MPPRKKNTLLEKIAKNAVMTRDKKCIIACSGGPDSMVLLSLFEGGNIPSNSYMVAHVHHGLRKSADHDEKLVRDYCKTHGLTLEVLHADIRKEAKKTKTTVEECARNVRRAWFESLKKKHHADSIVTAHHANDQMETLLYRIAKGTSITGLVGIEPLAGAYVRPLLPLSKWEILLYAAEHGIPYGHDETNDDTSIPRNLLRHEVVPRLQVINPEAVSAFIRLGQSARELKTGFDVFFAEILDKGVFGFDWYHSLPLGFQHELLRCLYERANGSTQGLSTALIEELDRFLSTRNGGKKEVKKLSLRKEKGKIIFPVL